MKRQFFLLLAASLLCIPIGVSAQEQITCSGVVVDLNGSLIPGVAVFTSSGSGSITDEDGAYSISAKKGEEIQFSCLGYETDRKSVV